MKGAKRTGIFAAAIVLSLGLAVSAGYGAKTTKVASEVEVDGFYFDGADREQVLVGDVHANKPKCEKARAVTVYTSNTGFDDPPAPGTGEQSFEVTTDKYGDWELSPEADEPNWTTASVARKKVTKKSGKKLNCSADTAPVISTD